MVSSIYKNYDFDVNKYNVFELTEMLGIPKSNLNDESFIRERVDYVISFYVKKYENEDLDNQKQQWIYFFNSAKIKLLNYAKQQRDEMRITDRGFKPTTSNIYNSLSVTQGSGHNVTTNKIVPVQHVSNWDFPNGVINPVERRTITKIVAIDSVFRANYCTTLANDFIWTLPETVKNVVSMKVVSMELPCTWYTVSSAMKSNTFIIRLFNMKGQANISHIITIPDGNYMSSNFESTIDTYFQNIKQGLEFLYVNVDTLSTKTIIRAREKHDDKPETVNFPKPYDPKDARYSPNFYFILDFTSQTIKESITNTAKIATTYNCKNFEIDNKQNKFTKSLGWFMGFRKPYYRITRNQRFVSRTKDPVNPITYLGYVSSESSYGGQLQNYVFLDINDYNSNEIANTFVSSLNNASNRYMGNNIIARVAVSTPFFSVLFNSSIDNVFKKREYLGPVRLKKLQIRLLNKFGDLIDLNNNDFSFALELTVLYQ